MQPQLWNQQAASLNAPVCKLGTSGAYRSVFMMDCKKKIGEPALSEQLSSCQASMENEFHS